MKVFISWSGSLSRQVAAILRDWLPNVIQAIEPWMSEEDIGKGSRWSPEVANQLQVAKAGIICATPENQHAAWLNYEAGALSKIVESSLVCTFLFRMSPSELKGPLTQFQATETNKEDVLKLLQTLNKALGSHMLPEDRLLSSFDNWWEKLQVKFHQIPMNTSAGPPKRTVEDMVEEILSLSRDYAKSMVEVATRQHSAEVRQLERENRERIWASDYRSLYGNPIPSPYYSISSDSSGGIYAPASPPGTLLTGLVPLPGRATDLPEHLPSDEYPDPIIEPAGEGPPMAPPLDLKGKP